MPQLVNLEWDAIKARAILRKYAIDLRMPRRHSKDCQYEKTSDATFGKPKCRDQASNPGESASNT